MTQQDKLCLALLAIGCEEVASKSRKVRTFLRRKYTSGADVLVLGPRQFWFVGKMGSLRFGATLSQSMAASDHAKARLLEQLNKATESAYDKASQ